MTLLILGGTAEARKIAWSLVDGGRKAVVSLAGATRNPEPLPLETRIGGFGGDEGFAEYLRSNAISAVLDATHPFATSISARSARIAAEHGLPYCCLRRPGWEAGPDDRWTLIEREEDAAAHIASGATVFLATGRQTLSRFANLEGRRVICRLVDPPAEPFPFEGGEFLIGRPPFSAEREEQLLAALGVDVMVVKDSGGEGGQAKLTAARELGIPVLVIRRPPPPEVTLVTTVGQALAWVAALPPVPRR